MELYFLRHGQTDWNLESRYQGQVDIPLNETGIRQGKEVAERLRSTPIDACYASPLRRAQDTAKFVLEGRDIPLLTDSRLLEYHFGIMEGVHYQEARQPTHPFYSFHADPVHYLPPEGAERFEDILARAQSFLEEMKTRPGERILAVAHGLLIRSVLVCAQGLGKESIWKGNPLGNCSVTVLRLEGERYRIVTENLFGT